MTAPFASRLHAHPIGLAGRYLRHHRAGYVWALLWRAGYVLLPMQVPLLAGAIADTLAGNAASVYGWQWAPGDTRAVLTFAGAGLLVVAVLTGLATFMRAAATAHLARRFVTHLRKALAERMATLPLAVQHRYGAGELMDRLVSDAGRMRKFIDRVFVQSPTNLLRIVYPVAMLLWLDWRLALIALAVVPPQWLVLRTLYRRLQVATRAARSARSALMQAAKEAVDGAEDAQALGAEAAVVDLTCARADALEERQLRQSLVSASVTGTTQLATAIGMGLTWWVGGLDVLAGAMTLGTLVAFTGFLAFAYRPARQMSRAAGTFQSGLVSLERIHDLLERAPSRERESADDNSVPSAESLRRVAGALRFQGVSMDYGRGRVLRDLDLDLPARALTALVGPSGCGKSTLLRLAARLYRPTQGRVLLDDRDLDTASLVEIREAVALVPQRPALFSLSVLDNLRLGQPSATEADVIAACRAAGAHRFIEALPEGYATPLGVGGTALSGGQRQRLALARALLRLPAVLLLDEPTSALDAAHEAEIVETLRALSDTMTVVAVTHRPALAEAADHVVVLEDGRLLDAGPHAALQLRSATYAALFPSADFTLGDGAAVSAAWSVSSNPLSS